MKAKTSRRRAALKIVLLDMANILRMPLAMFASYCMFIIYAVYARSDWLLNVLLSHSEFMGVLIATFICAGVIDRFFLSRIIPSSIEVELGDDEENER